ncbi:hypothetical protein F5B19DRAFT_458326 [Rostrohypoxylon terebratum]|nr:hypothetical protein F5B19DRAFT_458326 [Rostrohypoxylon terebratum]
MRPFTLIVATTATILALPQPHPAGINDAEEGILGGLNSGLNGIFGSPEARRNGDQEGGYQSSCEYRNNDGIASCVTTCANQCAADPEGCDTCIRGCPSKYGCDSHGHEGKRHHHHHDKHDRRVEGLNSEDESSE